ncbi:hypothetical protein CGRA01v4_02094 [Colletotrichum graminicola]|nr:hypothetical protein CGRA01v4_02094 [Colletotrichum graminicola]
MCFYPKQRMSSGSCQPQSGEPFVSYRRENPPMPGAKRMNGASGRSCPCFFCWVQSRRSP